MERTVILYIAMSLDGYLADPEGGVDWLVGHDPDAPDGGGYRRFLERIDTVLMGYRTYHQVTTQLSPEKWVYEGLNAYVLTHRQGLAVHQNITFIQMDAAALVARLKQESGKGIWVCGGADVVGQLVEADLIDTYYISIIPTLLGDGIRLFPQGICALPLRLLSHGAENGILECVYARR